MMKYIEIFILIVISIYPFSYAKYNWSKKNKLGAVGMVLLAITAIVYPSVLLLIR